jgi:hypothetical protein
MQLALKEVFFVDFGNRTKLFLMIFGAIWLSKARQTRGKHPVRSHPTRRNNHSVAETPQFCVWNDTEPVKACHIWMFYGKSKKNSRTSRSFYGRGKRKHAIFGCSTGKEKEVKPQRKHLGDSTEVNSLPAKTSFGKMSSISRPGVTVEQLLSKKRFVSPTTDDAAARRFLG